MNPAFQPLFDPLPVQAQYLPAYKRLLGGIRVVDALYHWPHKVGFRHKVLTHPDFLGLALEDKPVVTTLFTASHYQRPVRKGQPLIIEGYLVDETPTKVVYFNGNPAWIEKLYPLGTQKCLKGEFVLEHGAPVLRHPDFVGPASIFEADKGSYPIYALTAGLSLGVFSAVIQRVLDTHTPDLPEWIPPAVMAEHSWLSWREAMRQVHSPHSDAECEAAQSPTRQRLIFDEFLAHQLDIIAIKKTLTPQVRSPIATTAALYQQLLRALPFQLTDCQHKAIADCVGDMQGDVPMRRLVQGDVGSGKTVVAFGAAVHAMEAGFQVAYLAPTEILARQHHAKLGPLCEALGVSMGLMLGGVSQTKQAKMMRHDLASGGIRFIVGTHALLETAVEFQNLGLAIIDEQHRFGVEQRLKLLGKNAAVDLLTMTATPIPRSLQLTAFGDMDVSVIRTKPAGRIPIITTLMDQERLLEVVAGLKRHLSAPQEGLPTQAYQEGLPPQAYWVCPLVEASATLDVAAAESRLAFLTEHLGPTLPVGLVHGRMKKEAKDAVMQAFIQGQLRVLVATTVIEVGVDVPNATLMVIDNSQRFGLAQLHQLRGRVGRGREQSYCLLLYSHPLTDTAKRRLAILRESEDGFLIAEEDLNLRGGGDIYGTQQSGFHIFKVGDLRRDYHLLRQARRVAQTLGTSQNPGVDLVKALHNRATPKDYTKAG